MGGVLYQINVKDEKKKDIICFHWKSFDEARHATCMRASPFHREALALAHMIKQCEGMASMSEFPLQVWTDHMPLSFLRKVTRGPLAEFVLFHMANTHFVVNHVHRLLK